MFGLTLTRYTTSEEDKNEANEANESNCSDYADYSDIALNKYFNQNQIQNESESNAATTTTNTTTTATTSNAQLIPYITRYISIIGHIVYNVDTKENDYIIDYSINPIHTTSDKYLLKEVDIFVPSEYKWNIKCGELPVELQI